MFFIIKWPTLEPIFSKIEAYFDLQGVGMNCEFVSKISSDTNNTLNGQVELKIQCSLFGVFIIQLTLQIFKYSNYKNLI